MRTFSSLVLILGFIGIAQAVLIVPYWMHQRGIKSPDKISESSTTTTSTTIPTTTTTENNVSVNSEEVLEQDKLNKRENAEKFNMAAMHLMKSPKWKSIAKEEKQFIQFIMIFNVLEYKIDPSTFDNLT